MKSVILYAHDNSANHGCEALARCSIRIIRKSIDIENLDLITDSESIDRYYMGDICNYRELHLCRKSLGFIISYLKYRLTGSFVSLDTYPYRSIIRSVSKDAIALSIGGDNYCYGYSAYYADLNRQFRKFNHKTVLWGCSINKGAFKESGIIEDLKSYSLITARESLTYDLLRSAGVKNVMLFPDPAFTLDTDYSALPEDFEDYRTIGINASPMVQDNESQSGCAIENYQTLIQFILKETDYNIALIPHVIWKQSDDRVPLQLLYDEFKDSGRIRMIEDANAEQLKGVISKCRFMVAARTHASIAAYSTYVPSLVVGYSVKSEGIAKDIFGSYEDYVLPVQYLRTPRDLTEKFRWIMDHETEIRTHLQEFMPGYIARAWEAGETLKQI